ncbi:uncharacterized protein LMH87_008401 [Akanthomyces muscarius]|uniref:GST N-terminal domain-containing protein n=1 Tax=Akanthomyces muscarius TaxID=2231603 RepID=A0A9W8QM14_AKAMU|nr:uncharacterized protein LMH87_008401 [Akanthomyces muscarius]KAJ4159503.1 hypothetical protein LMH87_008401 [Akanthomyces muscarius]
MAARESYSTRYEVLNPRPRAKAGAARLPQKVVPPGVLRHITVTEASLIEQAPLRVKNSKHHLQFFTQNSPNGKQVQILLEELRDAAGIDCETQLIDLDTDDQKKKWFLALNQAGKISVLVDSSSPEGPVLAMESPAILLHLQENYDADNLFGLSSAYERSQVHQWLFMWHSAARHHGLTRAFINDASSDPRPEIGLEALRNRAVLLSWGAAGNLPTVLLN